MQKMFQFSEWMRKDFIPWNSSWRLSAETWDEVASKNICWKNNSVPNTCNISPLKTIFFSELSRCIFQISLKYIKLVVPKILFIMALCSFNFYFKIMWPHLNNIHPRPTTIKVSEPPSPSKDFSEIFNHLPLPHPQAGGEVHALYWWGNFYWEFIIHVFYWCIPLNHEIYTKCKNLTWWKKVHLVIISALKLKVGK